MVKGPLHTAEAPSRSSVEVTAAVRRLEVKQLGLLSGKRRGQGKEQTANAPRRRRGAGKKI